MDLVRTVAPDPLFPDLMLIKQQLRISNSASDAVLEHYAALAQNILDGRFGYLRRALMTQEWRLTLCQWPWNSVIELPLPPLQEVVSITYFDAANVQQTLSPAEYVVVTSELVGRVQAAPLGIWPSVYNRHDAIQVAFKCGYGDDPENVPVEIRQAALLYVAKYWADRGTAGGANVTFASVDPDDTQKRLLARYRIQEFL